jgi:hypothetical protein
LVKKWLLCVCVDRWIRLAIEGTVVMSEHLQQVADAIYDAQIPPTWMQASWWVKLLL